MFNLFKKSKKEEPNSPALEEFEKATEQFNSEKYSEALGTLITAFKKDIYYKPLYQLASDCLSKMGGSEESTLFLNAKNALNADSFKQLGNHFYQVEHYPLTKIFLEEAFKFNKDIDTANQLAISYARRFDTKKAQETLESVKDQFDFWTFWFYLKTKILNNDQSDLDIQIRELENAFDPNSQDENLKIILLKIKELRESFERLNSIEEPQQLIRDWHYIQYGSVILDFFFSDDQYVAGGRYVAMWGSNQSIKSNLLKLGNLINSKSIEKIVYGSDRDSQIIGIALGLTIDKPATIFDPNTTYSNSLFVTADSSMFNDFTQVEFIENNNLTFSYNQNWLQSTFICPDIVALLAQAFYYPWNGGHYKLNEDGTPSKTDPDTREPTQIAKDILNSEVEDEISIDPFYNWVKDGLKMNQTEGHRYNFMMESPIPGSYFGMN